MINIFQVSNLTHPSTTTQLSLHLSNLVTALSGVCQDSPPQSFLTPFLFQDDISFSGSEGNFKLSMKIKQAIKQSGIIFLQLVIISARGVTAVSRGPEDHEDTGYRRRLFPTQVRLRGFVSNLLVMWFLALDCHCGSIIYITFTQKPGRRSHPCSRLELLGQEQAVPATYRAWVV